MGRDKVTIKIPRELYGNLQGLIKNTGFGSVTEFIVHVLRDVASGGELQVSETEDGKEAGLSSQEIDLVRKRLKALGYIE
ncbi:MAG: CopG family transcriptional regulator [Phycisphaerae bacterium]|nr:CopG family transcriptional regulator [Phycisphaerae bacterium]